MKKKKIQTAESVIYQAVKSISKLVKTIKGFLIQKCVRKLEELKNDSSSDQYKKQTANLAAFKKIDHTEVGKFLVSALNGAETESLEISESLLNAFKTNKKVLEEMEQWRKKFADVIAAAKKAAKAKPAAKRSLTEVKLILNIRFPQTIMPF